MNELVRATIQLIHSIIYLWQQAIKMPVELAKRRNNKQNININKAIIYSVGFPYNKLMSCTLPTSTRNESERLTSELLQTLIQSTNSTTNQQHAYRINERWKIPA